MRLIDGDALDYALGASDEDIYFHHMLEDAPTIDAIPVGWLKAHKLEYLEDWGVVPVAVGQALTMWQKEQEAR